MPAEFRYCGRCGDELTSPETDAVAASERPADIPAQDPTAAGQRTGIPEAWNTLPLTAAPATEPANQNQWDEEAPAEYQSQAAAISGPSFLGLSDGDAEPEDSYNYLLQDEPRRRHTGVFVLAVVLVALTAVFAVKWSTIHQYLAKVNQAPAGAYPNAADHGESGLAATPPQTTAPSAQASPPQMIVEEPAAAPAKEESAQPGAAVPQTEPRTQPRADRKSVV